ncbi:MAG: hypothetical protein CM15mP9_0270 [Methanobacteriota archaeon]|nr:MAG: hypothetical protein CM15mP9_0270 [Euryarchaeota archaeon]
MSLEAAKASVDSMVSDSDYPRSVNSEELEAIPEPVELFPSAVINHFIDTMEMDEEILDAELESPATVINDLDIPGWEEEVIESADFRGSACPLESQLVHSEKPSYAKWVARTSASTGLQPSTPSDSYRYAFVRNAEPAWANALFQSTNSATTNSSSKRIPSLFCWS